MRALGPKYYNTDALGGFKGFGATVLPTFGVQVQAIHCHIVLPRTLNPKPCTRNPSADSLSDEDYSTLKTYSPNTLSA